MHYNYHHIPYFYHIHTQKWERLENFDLGRHLEYLVRVPLIYVFELINPIGN